MPDYEFNLPYPPTVNHYHQPVRQGRGVRIIKGAKARAYQAEAVAALVAAGLDGEAIAGPVKMTITLNPPTLARYDVDGRPKGVLDALTAAGFWLDDCLVVDYRVVKMPVVKGGKLELTITELETA